MVSHPLTPEQGKRHVVTTYATRPSDRGRSMDADSPAALVRVDPLVPLLPAARRRLVRIQPACVRPRPRQRRLGRARERSCCGRSTSSPIASAAHAADAALRRARSHSAVRTRMGGSSSPRLRAIARDQPPSPRRTSAPTHAVVPMGAWLDRPRRARRRIRDPTDRLPRPPDPRQGVSMLLDASRILRVARRRSRRSM